MGRNSIYVAFCCHEFEEDEIVGIYTRIAAAKHACLCKIHQEEEEGYTQNVYKVVKVIVDTVVHDSGFHDNVLWKSSSFSEEIQ